MTMEKILHKKSNFIYIDSIEAYNPQIGDVVKYNRETCKITQFRKNIRQIFGLVRDNHNQHIEHGDIKKETMLGNLCYRSEDVCEYNVSLHGEATIYGTFTRRER